MVPVILKTVFFALIPSSVGQIALMVKPRQPLKQIKTTSLAEKVVRSNLNLGFKQVLMYNIAPSEYAQW